MCGKDGMQRGVYKLKGKHERGIGKKKVEKRKGEEKKGFVLVTREKYSGYQLKNLECS